MFVIHLQYHDGIVIHSRDIDIFSRNFSMENTIINICINFHMKYFIKFTNSPFVCAFSDFYYIKFFGTKNLH